MAFKTPTDEAIDWAERNLAGGLPRITREHDAAVKELLEAANAADGSVDTARTLAAIKSYREAMNDEKAGLRGTFRTMAQYLIAVGLPPGRVCRDLGFGRTAMNAAMSKHTSLRLLIEPGTKSVKKRVA